MTLCDLHTHVLPGVDDGAQTMDQALQMLQNAVASDVQYLVVTPHCNVPGTSGNYRDEVLEERFLQLQQAAQELPLTLALGAEARVTEQLPQLLRQGRIPTLNDSRYVLTEFPMDFPDEAFSEALGDILDSGYVPLVAHPERYMAVCRKPAMVESWLDMGCHIQLTGGSILGAYGKTVQRTAAWLLRQDLVCCVASDAHGITRRSNFLLDVWDHLSIYYSKAYANCLMHINPMRICGNESL